MELNDIIKNLRLEGNTETLLSGYLKIRFRDLETHTPYWRDKLSSDGETLVSGFLGGKGEPEEIEKEVEKQLSLIEESQRPRTPGELFDWMKKRKIGVDCSGLAFAMLKALSVEKGDTDWETRIIPTAGGNPANAKRFRTSARALCSQENARQVEESEEIRTGDLIRLESGAHVIFVLGKLEEETIYYVHSSRMTEVRGAHIGVVQTSGNMEDWQWEEKLKSTGESLGSLYNPESGDGVFRMKGW